MTDAERLTDLIARWRAHAESIDDGTVVTRCAIVAGHYRQCADELDAITRGAPSRLQAIHQFVEARLTSGGRDPLLYELWGLLTAPPELETGTTPTYACTCGTTATCSLHTWTVTP